MSTTLFKRTIAQTKATALMGSLATHIMSYGGSRSGKTFNIIRAIIIRASKHRSRHVILRLNFNHCKTSIWLDTLPKVLRVCFPDLLVSWNKSDYFLTLPNGSEIWIGGLDDDKRVEKILGKEYSTIFFNECSQISWSSIQVALTRLAEKSELKNKAYYDENPPTKRHWSYWVFVKKIHPDTGEPLEHGDYESILMNPNDNLENIDENYLKILNSLDEKQRARFLLGEFNEDSDGQAYYSFNRDNNVMAIDGSFKQGSTLIGMDFNVQPMTAVIGNYINKTLYIYDEVFLENSDTFKMCSELKRKGHKGSRIYPDSTGANRKTSGKSDHAILNEDGFTVAQTRNPFVTDRVNNVNRLLRDGRIIIDPKCKKLINDLEKVTWKNDDLDQKTDKMLTHISDALGYLCHAIDPLIGLPPKSSSIKL
jgi:PBSX family phage terminase large subunit